MLGCCRSYTALITFVSEIMAGPARTAKSGNVPGDPSASGISLKFPSSPCTWVPSHNKWARGLGYDVLLDFGLKWNWGHGWRICVDWWDAASSTDQAQPQCLKELLILAEFCHNNFFFSNELSGETGHQKWAWCWRETQKSMQVFGKLEYLTVLELTKLV